MWPLVEHISAHKKHCMDDPVRLTFERRAIKDSARLQTKWLKMLFAHSYGDAVISGGREVFLRKLPYGTTEEIPVSSVRSHIVKHGASENAAASGVPWPVSMQVCVRNPSPFPSPVQ